MRLFGIGFKNSPDAIKLAKQQVEEAKLGLLKQSVDKTISASGVSLLDLQAPGSVSNSLSGFSMVC